ncbi:MAG: Smr/MutS family protein [Flavobacteriales bacterium]|nr:Smr/MutS family protein [Flavobacteriales bacterium]
MEFKQGDQVRFLNDAGEGKIIEFPGPGIALVEDESGFSYPHPISELVPVGDWWKENAAYNEVQQDIRDMLERNIDPELTKKATDDFNLLYKNREATNIKRKGETMEVDLHIHALLDNHRNMTNSEIVEVQIIHFERMLRIAEKKKIPRCIFIHGVGQGVLRAEIRKLITQYYPNASFMDASYTQYGYGATEVRLRFS